MIILRTLNSLKNIIGNFANNIVLNLLKFVSRIIFVKVLDEVYLGVNGLLSNVLGILALAELGIGGAIGFALYKPLAEDDRDKIATLMRFYGKAYRIIGCVVAVVGLLMMPFLNIIITEQPDIQENLYVIYLLYLFLPLFSPP